MNEPAVLLVIGVHREELAFGQAVASGLDPARVDVLAIPDGLSGRHPRPDQRFHWDTLHRALYLQLPPHIQPRHRLLIDLHTGQDNRATGADLYSRSPARLAALLAGSAPWLPAPRMILLGGGGAGIPQAETVIPPEVWRDPPYLYVGMEIYLTGPGAGRREEQEYCRRLIVGLAENLALEAPSGR